VGQIEKEGEYFFFYQVIFSPCTLSICLRVSTSNTLNNNNAFWLELSNAFDCVSQKLLNTDSREQKNNRGVDWALFKIDPFHTRPVVRWDDATCTCCACCTSHYKSCILAPQYFVMFCAKVLILNGQFTLDFRSSQ
jgi:hypothetical protein